MITNRQKVEIPMNFLTNAGSKIVDGVVEITGAGQTKFHPEMISNVLSLNEMTQIYRENHSIQEMNIILTCIL